MADGNARSPDLAPSQAIEHRRKVIIVDDDRETRGMLTLAMELEGFAVSEAANGLRLISNLQVDKPDAVLLDVMMTWIDGYELCRAIKRNNEYRNIPVIFVSARKSPQDVAKGMAAGADDYFSKPVDINRLVKRIGELIDAGAKREAAAPATHVVK